MIIEVKQKHIRAGKRFSCKKCPFALAMKDQGAANPWVGVKTADDVGANSYLTSGPAQKFIKRFDSKKPVRRARFRLLKVSP